VATGKKGLGGETTTFWLKWGQVKESDAKQNGRVSVREKKRGDEKKEVLFNRPSEKQKKKRGAGKKATQTRRRAESFQHVGSRVLPIISHELKKKITLNGFPQSTKVL